MIIYWPPEVYRYFIMHPLMVVPLVAVTVLTIAGALWWARRSVREDKRDI